MTGFFSAIRKCSWISLCVTIISVHISAFNGHKALYADEELLDIKFNSGQLSVKLKNAPLEKVLREIMSQSGAKIWLNDTIDVDVTLEFQNVNIEAGVRKILKDKNYAFIYTPNEAKEGKLSIITANKPKEAFTKGKQDITPKTPQKPVVKKEKPKKEKPSFESLVKDALENADAGKREDAIIDLGETKDKRAIETIAKALANDASEDVRLSAIDALLEIGDKSIVEPISLALKDKDPWVRESAVEALGEIGSDAAVEFIKSALSDEDGSVRELAQDTLDELNKKKK